MLAAVGGGSVRADAQTAAQAESLLRQAHRLRDAGRTTEACTVLDASAKLEPSNAKRVEQAECREQAGQLSTAWSLLIEIERETRGDESQQKVHQIAVERAVRLEPRLSMLTIDVADRAGGLVVRRGGVVIEPVTWGQSLPIDGGSYTITASAPDRESWTAKLVVRPEADIKIVRVPKLAPLHPEPAAAPAKRERLISLGLGGGAIALLGGALGVELWARGTYDDAKAARTASQRDSLWHSANTKRHVAQTMAVTGLACAGVAVWLWLRTNGEAATNPRGVAIAPLAEADLAGLALNGSW